MGEQVRESYDDLKASAASQSGADAKPGAGTSPGQDSAADAQSAEQSQQQRQPSAGSSSREEPPGGAGFAASGAGASSSGVHCMARQPFPLYSAGIAFAAVDACPVHSSLVHAFPCFDMLAFFQRNHLIAE